MSGRIARGAMALVAAGLALAVPGRASAACQTYQANGSPWTTTTCDDGSRATTYRAPGSPWSTTTYDDGTSASTYESGDWITTTWSDGTRTAEPPAETSCGMFWVSSWLMMAAASFSPRLA